MNKQKASLLLIITLALFFRFYNLSTNPPSLFRDEAEKGYTAYSIMKTGGYRQLVPEIKTGRLPFHYFPMFILTPGSATSALYQYLSIPFIAIFGLNEFGVRFTAAFFSLMTILLLYYLVKEIWGERFTLPAIFFLAVSPWHLSFSRWAQQGILIPFFFLIGILLFEKGRKNHPKLWILSALSFGIAFYGYVGFMISILLFLLMLLIVFNSEIEKNIKYFTFSIIILSLIVIPTLFFTIFTPSGSERFQRVSLLASSEFSSFQKTIYFFKNYITYYLPQFYLLNGDINQRHNITSFGIMNLFEFPFFLIGLIISLKRREKWDLILLGWFIIFPISAALTNEGNPHSLRTLCAIPMPQIFAAFGFIKIKDYFEKIFFKAKEKNNINLINLLKNLKIIFISFIILNIIYIGFLIFIVYPAGTGYAWQYGFKESLAEAKKVIGFNDNKSSGSIYISGNIPYGIYLLLFYEKIDPQILKDNKMDSLPYKILSPYIDLKNFWLEVKPPAALVAYPQEINFDLNNTIKIYYNENVEESDPKVAAMAVLYKK